MEIKEWQEYITSWAEAKGFVWTPGNIDTILLRLHSEVSEASECARDEELGRLGEEFADLFIRLANACEVMGIDLEKEVEMKMAKNEERAHLHGHQRK
jgi:NTP pyrophosphatase (non-canonical NTP hydrolase)